MKKLLFIIGVLMSVVSSCDIVTSDNGRLDGLWQLRTVEHLSTGQTRDGRDADVQWAFQGRILQLKARTDTVFTDVVCSFSHVGDTLTVSDPYFSGRFIAPLYDDVKVANAKYLKVYGVYQLEEHFKVLQLDGDNMCLESDSVRLSFRKY